MLLEIHDHRLDDPEHGSLLIPTRGSLEYLWDCLRDLLEANTYVRRCYILDGDSVLGVYTHAQDNHSLSCIGCEKTFADWGKDRGFCFVDNERRGLEVLVIGEDVPDFNAAEAKAWAEEMFQQSDIATAIAVENGNVVAAWEYHPHSGVTLVATSARCVSAPFAA